MKKNYNITNYIFIILMAINATSQAQLSCVTRIASNSDPKNFPNKQVTLSCDTGYTVMGGGAECYDNGNWYGRLTKSFPNENGWSATCQRYDYNGSVNNEGAQIISNIYAICCKKISNITNNIENNSDCIFSWMEKNYSELLVPKSTQSKSLSPYYYRYYSSTNSYLGTSSIDNHLYYIGVLSGNKIMDIGAIDKWKQTAGCQ